MAAIGKPRVCYFGTYEKPYPRNSALIKCLTRAGAEVHECHAPVWELREDKSGSYRGLSAILTILRLFIAHLRLIVRYWRTPPHDVMIVGYVGQFDMPLAWALSRLRSVPLVYNPLVSLYDTFCNDRGLVRPGSPKGKVFRWLDRLSCRLADLVLVDTEQHLEFFSETFGIPSEKFRVIPVGADDDLFAASPLPERGPGEPFEVLFVGKLIPLHGCETILRAASLLRDEGSIRFTIVGSGQQGQLVRRLAAELGLSNLSLVDWVEYEDLPALYARADLCLGIFSDSEKAARVVPNKAYQALASGRPLLSADTPALRSAFRPGEEAWTCRAADPADLAEQVRRLAGDAPLRRRLALAGHEAFRRSYGLDAIAAAALSCLAELLPGIAPEDRMTWGAQPEFYGPRHRFREDYLVRAVRRHAPGRTLIDAACGAGTLARRLAREDFEVLAVDLSADFLRHIRGREEKGRIALVRGDITQLPCDSGRVDGIVAGEVLEHLPDDAAALREFWRVLRAGGICALSVPAEPAQWDWHDNWAGHLRRYRREELRKVLEEAQFDVLSIHHFGFPFARAFHRYAYLPQYRRKLRACGGRLDQLKVSGRWSGALSGSIHAAFQLDNFFNGLPWGIGLIAVARKPGGVAGCPR